jgi:hypothetical protein
MTGKVKNRLPRFCKSEKEFKNIHENLKLYQCPVCLHIGFFILHGFLYGYGNNSQEQNCKRGHRVYCSNRNLKGGCGHTCCILYAVFIRNKILPLSEIWNFIKAIVYGNSFREASFHSGIRYSTSTRYLLLRLFDLNQPHMRSYLYKQSKPPAIDIDNTRMQTIKHIENVFSDSPCPLADFQDFFQVDCFMYRN